MNKKVFAHIALIVLVVVLAGVLGYIALVKKPSSTNTRPPSQTQVIVSKNDGSMVYQSTKYGYSFLFPSGTLLECRETAKLEECKDLEMTINGTWGGSINILQNNNIPLTTFAFNDLQSGKVSFVGPFPSFGLIEVGGREAWRTTIYGRLQEPQNSSTTTERTIVLYTKLPTGDIFRLNLPKVKSLEKLIPLSFVRDTTDWLTYKGPNFEFKYPKSFMISSNISNQEGSRIVLKKLGTTFDLTLDGADSRGLSLNDFIYQTFRILNATSTYIGNDFFQYTYNRSESWQSYIGIKDRVFIFEIQTNLLGGQVDPDKKFGEYRDEAMGIIQSFRVTK